MKTIFYLSFILLLMSCDEDDNKDIRVLPIDKEAKCDFSNFNIKYKYIKTLEKNVVEVNIYKNTEYDSYTLYKNFNVTITDVNSRDTTDSLKIVALQVGCNSTGTEFDVDNCKIVSEVDFVSTMVYCNGLDDFIFDRIRNAEMTYHSKDTIVFYEYKKNWYHYFISDSTEEIENKQDLPKLRIKSNEIYTSDDTLYIPINYNFLKNDSTNCYFYGIKVEPQYKDWNNSFIILPEPAKPPGIDYDYRILSNFMAISNSDTICRIDSIIFFRGKWFNNVSVFLGNTTIEIIHKTSSNHPQNGSNNSYSLSYQSSFSLAIKYNAARPTFSPSYSYYIPLLLNLSNNTFNEFKLKQPIYQEGGYQGGREASMSNCGIVLERNKNSYEIYYNDKNFLNEFLKIGYGESYRNGPSSTQISSYTGINKVTYTDSSYVKLKFWRD